MLLPPALVYAVGGVGVAALVGVFVNDRLVTPRRWLVRTLIGVMIACAAITLTLLFGTTRVTMLTADRTLDHSLLLGSSTLRVGERDVELPYEVGTTIVINDARTTARLETIIYGASGLDAPEVVEIAPGTVHVMRGKLDYLGPDQPPPDQISSKSVGETKHWLTW